MRLTLRVIAEMMDVTCSSTGHQSSLLLFYKYEKKIWGLYAKFIMHEQQKKR